MEGDPGSGKSVLLRKVAREVCRMVLESKHQATPVALYLNLKLLERNRDQAIDKKMIRQFVANQLKRANDEKVDRYVDEELESEIRQGRWLFVFDSFDEIPEVLNAEETSDVIDQYSKAIFEFSTEFNKCRSILATRHFRRPRGIRPPWYKIVPLTDKQREKLINRAGLLQETRKRLYEAISTPGPGLRYMIENPMYLGMLIDYITRHSGVPTTSHELFAAFVDDKLAEHRSNLRAKFSSNNTQVRKFAELIAFTIVADPSLGLNPKRTSLLASVGPVQPDALAFYNLFDALEELRFGWSDSDPDTKDARFTFSHRRFQEYFATAYVQSSPGEVTDKELIFEPRWRETVVILLRASTRPKLDSMLQLIREALVEAVRELAKAGLCVTTLTEHGEQTNEIGVFPWPPLSLHLLSLLEDSFAENAERLPSDIRVAVSEIVRAVFAHGRLNDRILALNRAGSIPTDQLIPILRAAIAFGSEMLDDIAFQQIRRVENIPKFLSRWIRLKLISRALAGHLWYQRKPLLAFLNRVRDKGRLVSATRLLTKISRADWALHLLFALSLMLFSSSSIGWRKGGVLAVVVMLCPAILQGVSRLFTRAPLPSYASANSKNRLLAWVFGPSRNLQEVREEADISRCNSIIVLSLILRWKACLFIGFYSPVWAIACVFLTGWAPMALAATLLESSQTCCGGPF